MSAHQHKTDIKAGWLYSVKSGDSQFGIVKVLVLEPEAVHVRLYKQRYSSRPHEIDESILFLGTMFDPDGSGIGHLPLSHQAFAASEPEPIKASPVQPSELEGYEEWKKAGGGVWS